MVKPPPVLGGGDRNLLGLSGRVWLPGGARQTRIADYLAYLELARRRVSELRAAGELSEAEIADRVTAEVLELHPDWQNQIWARKAVEDLTWPARA